MVAARGRRVRRGARRDRLVRLVAAGRLVHRADGTSLGAPHRPGLRCGRARTAVLAGLLAGRPLGLVPAAYVIGLGGVAVGLWVVRTSPPVERE